MTHAPKFMRMWLKEPLLSIILILCLAIGMSAYILITVYLSYQLSWDRHQPNGENTYTLQTIYTKNGECGGPMVSLELARTLLARLPQIKDVYTVMATNFNMLFIYNDQPIDMRSICITSKNALQYLGLDMLYGDAATCLEDKKSLVISESMAQKIFGNEEPIGQVIEQMWEGKKISRFVVTGVFADLPENRHIQTQSFVWIDSYDITLKESSTMCDPEEFNKSSSRVFFILEEGTDPSILEREAHKIFDEVKEATPNYDPSIVRIFRAVPLKEIHYQNLYYEELETFDRKKLVKFGILALAILMVLVSNTIILFLVRILGRRGEMEIRRSVGASGTDIVRQFLAEHSILYMLVLVVTFVTTWLTMPYMKSWIPGLPHQMSIDSSFWLYTVLGLAVGGIVTVVYPALLARMMTGKNSRTNHWKLFMTIQLVISLVLMTSSMLLFRQVDHITKKDNGLDARNVMSYRFVLCQEEFQKLALERTRDLPGVESAAVTNLMPTMNTPSTRVVIRGNKSTGDYSLCNIGLTTPGLFDVFKIPLVKGRVWDDADSPGVIVNEEFVRRYGHHGIDLGVEVKMGEDNPTVDHSAGEIIGIVKDCWWTDVRKPVDPIVYCNDRIYEVNFHYRLRPGYEKETIAEIKKVFYELEKQYQFREVDYDTQWTIDHDFDAERAFLQIVLVASLIGVFFTFVGVYGLTAYTLKRQMRGMAIRKVLGATSWDMLKHLLKDYTLILGIALGISIPFSYYLLTRWLYGFASRVQLCIVDFAFGLICTFLIVFIAVLINWSRLNRSDLFDISRTE